MYLKAEKMSFPEIEALLNSSELLLDAQVSQRIENSCRNFNQYLQEQVPIYGVTTGFGDSCHRAVNSQDADLLQDNLISYLLMGTGKALSADVGQAVLLFRLISLSRGYSGVSLELVSKMLELYNKRIFPVIPREGSLGASGDLIPLAYLAHNIRGQGEVYYRGELCDMESLVKSGVYEAYDLKPKEGLALVNGTTAMAALAFHNLRLARYLAELGELCSGWLCLTIQGRSEAFSELVNSEAKTFGGQGQSARHIRQVLTAENYNTVSYRDISHSDGEVSHLVQDPYSLRCAPQVLGPIVDTLGLIENWITTEVNGVSDNPLFDQGAAIANGGNFYGGYLSHGMDYLKICLANLSDLMDRQLTLLISEKTNRGLTPNLANWEGLSPQKRHLSHGLKGVHQNVSAVTSDIMAKAMPNSIFSRSSESHNQDKVSLGMTAAVQCADQLEAVTTVMACYLTCLAQAVDLRKLKLQGAVSQKYYHLIRQHVPFVGHDQRLDGSINQLRKALVVEAQESQHVFL